MFVVALLADTIRIPPPLLSRPTLTSVQSEIDRRYPNRVLGDVGLVVCPYGPPLDVGDGLLVPGDGGAHHQVVFRCVVFRPFVEEVLVGVVTESHPRGLRISVGGFFENVFVPAYWMLNPSRYEEGRGVWVWTPTYDDEEEDMEGGAAVKSEEGVEASADATDDAEGEEGENRFEIEIGAEIRFKVKAVNFTRITTTMKGVQATTTTTAHASDRAFGLNSRDGGSDRGSSSSSNGEGDAKLPPTATENGNGPDGGRAEEEEDSDAPVRRRSSSADLSDAGNRPAPMQIVGSICEDGLGLTSWWRGEDEDGEDGEEDGDGEKG